MSKVFISFLGIGGFRADPGYDVVEYHFQGDSSYRSRFSQRAIIEKMGADSFDKISILMTAESEAKHWDLLCEELSGIGVKEEALDPRPTLSAAEQSSTHQWRWFESLLAIIEEGDEVVFDFTHGFRSVPIIFSTAISFLQKVRPFHLLHAYYGYVSDRQTGQGKVIDMASFYEINQWADGVQALVQSADTSRMVELAPVSVAFQNLRETRLLEALTDLTSAIKDVDMNGIASRTAAALEQVNAASEEATDIEKVLLAMIRKKFSDLSEREGTGRYDADYFSTQMSLVKMLLDHKMHMQALTVMREVFVSIGMLGAKTQILDIQRTCSKGRKGRKGYGERFWGSLVSTEELTFDREEHRVLLEDLQARLRSEGILLGLGDLAKGIRNLRNGLSHGWTGKAKAERSIHTEAERYYNKLQSFVIAIEKAGLMRGDA